MVIHLLVKIMKVFKGFSKNTHNGNFKFKNNTMNAFIMELAQN